MVQSNRLKIRFKGAGFRVSGLLAFVVFASLEEEQVEKSPCLALDGTGFEQKLPLCRCEWKKC